MAKKKKLHDAEIIIKDVCVYALVKRMNAEPYYLEVRADSAE